MSNPAFLFQMGMVAKMIEARHKEGCNWSVEFVLRDAAGRVIMQCGDEPQWWWRSTIPTDPRKEVVQTGTQDGARDQPTPCNEIPVTPPAVSESAAGDSWAIFDAIERDMKVRGFDWYKLQMGRFGNDEAELSARGNYRPSNGADDDDEDEDLATACARIQLMEEWPGPDWSQAPEWAMWWAKDDDLPNAVWYRSAPTPRDKYWTMNATTGCRGFEYVNAPHFNYPGHWRDSLRERPK